MNYRHDFHAGNFADVFKHIVLTRILEHLKGKEKAFRVIDTHAGSGRYALAPAGERDHRGNPPEWVGGIGRLDGWQPPAEVAALVAPYLAAVAGEQENGADGGRVYPGSPLLALKLMRRQDRLTACERQPEAARRLKALFAGNYRARIIELDGWLVPGSQVPPKEKRGLLFTDPPFEEAADFDRMIAALRAAAKRWPGGTLAFWYPLKHAERSGAFKAAAAATGLSDIVAIEIETAPPAHPPVLHGCGMVIRHPPWRLEAEMGAILPELGARLAAATGGGRWRYQRLTAERPEPSGDG